MNTKYWLLVVFFFLKTSLVFAEKFDQIPYPSGFRVISSDCNQIKLAWYDYGDETQEIAYIIYRADETNRANYREIAYLPANTTEFTDNFINLNSDKVYYYSIKAVFNTITTEFSYPVSASFFCSSYSSIAPQNPRIISKQCGKIQIGWDDYPIDIFESGYLIYRSESENGNYVQISAVGASTLSYSDVFSVSENTTYYYKIKGRFGTKESDISTSVNASFTCSAPQNLAVSSTSCGQINITWSDYPAGVSETGYQIFRSDNIAGSSTSYIADVGANVLNYTDYGGYYGFEQGKIYYYSIRARFNYLTTQQSNTVDATTDCPTLSGLAVSATSCGSVSLQWNDFPSSQNEIGFEIGRADSENGYYYPVGSVSANVLTYTDTRSDLNPNQNYYYKVTGKFGNTLTNGPTILATTACVSPTGLQIVSTACGEIKLSWADYPTSIQETGFRIFRSIDEQGTYTYVGEVSANELQFIDRGSMQSGTNYYYKIKGRFNNSLSNFSDFTKGSFTCDAVALAVSEASCGKITLTWNDFPSNITESGFEIYRSETEIGNYFRIGSTSANVLTFSDNGNYQLENGKTYYYKIAGIINNSTTTLSSPVSASFTCPVPTGLKITSTECGIINLTWDDFPANLTENDYRIYRATTVNGSYYEISRVYNNVVSYSDKSYNFQPNQTYFYKIKAQFNYSITDFSTPVSASFTCPVPTGIKITSTVCGSISISWDDLPSNNTENSYIIYRSTSENEFYNSIGQVNSNVLNYTDNGNNLLPGKTYYYKIQAQINNAYSELSAFTSASFACVAPTGLRLAGSSCGKITLAWNDYANPVNENGYIIYRSTSETGTYQSVGSAFANFTSFTDFPPGNQTYYYKIKGKFINSESDFGNVIQASFTCTAPTNFRITGSTCGRINFTWNAFPANSGVTDYVIVRSESVNGTYYTATVTNGNVNTAFDDGTYSGNIFSVDKTYYYKIFARFSNTGTDYSNSVSGSFSCEVPTGLSVSSTSCGKINLTWIDYPSTFQETGYRIYRSDTELGNYSQIGSVNANVLSFTDYSNLVYGKTYFYKIKGQINNNIETGFSTIASGSFTCNAPIDFAVSSTSCGRINLSWSDYPVNSNEDYYDIYRSNIQNGNYSFLNRVAANTLTYTDVSSNLQFGATYYYKISGRFAQSETPLTNAISASFTCDSPTNLQFTSSSCGSITINWDDYPAGTTEVGYQILRSFTETGTYQSIGNVSANTLFFVDNTAGLAYGLTYYYKIKGKFNNTYSDFSNLASGSFTCSSPTGLAITQTKCGEISMSWEDFPVNINETGYEIWRSDTGQNGTYINIGTVNNNITFFTDNGSSRALLFGKTYFYKIKGKFNNSTTDFGNASSGSFTCGIPTGLAVESTLCGEISLKWDDFTAGTNETRYEIFRSDSENGIYSNRGSVGANVLTYTDKTTGLSPGKLFYYKIVGRFNTSNTDFSNVASGQFTCAVPTGLAVTSATCGQIKLSWNQYSSNGNLATYYNVYRATSELGTYTNIGTTYNNTPSFTDEGSNQFVPNTTYYYKIKARFGNIDTDFSLPINTSFTCDAPTGLTLISSKCGEIKLAWNDYPAQLQETGYRILRSDTGENGIYNLLTEVNANTLNYTDIGNNYALKPNTTYYYRILGRFSNYNYIYSSGSTAVSTSFTCDKPNGLAVVAASCGSVELTWDAYPLGSEYLGYSIYRSTNANSGFAYIAYVGKNINSYDDRTYGLNPNITYYYKIAGLFQRTNSELSDGVSASFTCIDVPTGLKVVSSNCGEVKLSWNDFPAGVNETAFEIYRNSPNYPNDIQRIGEVQTDILSFTDTGSYSSLSPNFEYTYKIRGKFGYVFSGYSNEEKASFTCEAITGLEVTSTECGNINLKWNNFSAGTANQNGFQIRRSINQNGPYEYIASLGKDILTYTDNALLRSGTTYYYKILGIILNTLVPESNVVSGSFYCDAPTNLRLESTSCGQIKLAWADYQSPNEETRYYIYRSETVNGVYSEIGNVNANVLDFNDISYNLIYHKTYYYKIRGLVNNGLSEFSNVISASFSCEVPTGLKAVSSCGVVFLTWTDYPSNLSESGYQIYRSDIGPNGPYNYARTTNANETYFLDQNVSDTTKTYYYKVAGRFFNSTTQYTLPVDTKFSCNRVPTGLKITNSECGRIELEWDQIIVTQNPLYNNQYYAIFRSTSQNGLYTLLFTTSSNTYTDSQNLSANFTYYYKIKLSQNAAFTDFSNTASSNFICSEPQNLELVNESCEKISIKWASVIGAISYNIYRSEFETGNFIFLKNVLSQPSDNQYIDAALGQGSKTYFYKIQAVFPNSINSVFSNIVKGNKTCLAVTGLKVVNTTCGEIKLAWDDFPAGINETGYKIYRTVYDGSGQSLRILVGQVAANILNFTDTGINSIGNQFTFDENINYEYSIRGIFGASDGNQSNTVSASFNCDSDIQLSVVENTCGQIKITWTDLPANVSESGFEVYFKHKNSSFYSKIASLNANILNYSHIADNTHQLAANEPYNYKVLAKIGAVNSAFSNEITTSFECNTTPQLSLVSTDCGNIKISWNDFAANLSETGFEIYRSENGSNGAYVKLTTLPANTTTFTDQGQYYSLVSGVNYHYKIAGFFGHIIYEKSNAIAATFNCLDTPPTLSLVSSNCGSISLSWTDISYQLGNYYAIYRASSLTNGEYVRINNLYTTENIFTDYAGSNSYNNYLESGIIYKYKIAKVINGTTSVLSSAVEASFTCPVATNLTAEITSCNTIKLNWDAIQGSGVSYSIFRSENGVNGNYKLLANLTVNSFIDQFQSLTNQTIFYKILVKFFTNTSSEYTQPISVQLNCGFTTIIPPQNLTSPTQTCSNITLNWSDFPAGVTEESYEIHRSTDNINFALIASPAANSTEFVDQNLTQNTIYYYKIRGRFSAGFSDFSEVISPKTNCVAVTNFGVNAETCTSISLTWSDLGAINTEESYELHRSTDGTNYEMIAHIDANATSYSDKNLPLNATYYYKIRGRFGAGHTPFTVPIIAKTACAGPTNFVANPINCTQILLTWSDLGPTNTEESYELYRSTTGLENSYEYIAKIDANSTQYLDQSLPNNQQFWYLLRGRFGTGFSPFSAMATAKTVPITLILKEKASSAVTLGWHICSSDRENWVIFMSTDGKNLTEIKREDALVEYSKIEYLTPGQTYYFWVSPILRTGYGNLSNMITITLPAFPKPSNLVSKAATDSTISLEWQDNSNGPDHEESWELMLQMADNKWITIDKIDANKINFAIDSLKADTTYCLSIRARHSMGFSEISNILCIKTNKKSTSSTIKSSDILTKNSRKNAEIDFYFNEETISIYPNPAQKYLILQFGQVPKSDINLSIINAIGQTVKTESINPNTVNRQYEVNIERIPNGLYFLKVVLDDIEKTVKFLKWN